MVDNFNSIQDETFSFSGSDNNILKLSTKLKDLGLNIGKINKKDNNIIFYIQNKRYINTIKNFIINSGFKISEENNVYFEIKSV